MNVNCWYICVVLIMSSSWITEGFLLDKSTIGPQLGGGSVITNQQFLSLIGLIADEKQHRNLLEQKVAALEKQQASVDQDSKIIQMENYIKQLENRISSVEQKTTSPVNTTCTCLAENEMIEKLSKRTMDIELKYSAIETRYNKFDHASNRTDQRINEMLLGDLHDLMTVNQTVYSFKNDLLFINVTLHQLESSGHVTSQDILALNRSLLSTVNLVSNNTLSISEIQYYMNISETIEKVNHDTTENSLKKLEDRQNQTDKSLSQFYDICNKTDQSLNQLQQEIVYLRNLWNETQIQTFYSLQKEVQTFISKFQQLESISQARSQDLLALYRKTQTTENYVTSNTYSISQIQNSMNQSETIATERYSTTENSLNKLENIQNRTNNYLGQLEHRNNVTYSELFSKIHNESEKVIGTVCTGTTWNYAAGKTVHYNNIKDSKGISSSFVFFSSGIFICEKPGLYIVMVSMRTDSLKSSYWIKKNSSNKLLIENIHAIIGVGRSVSGSLVVNLDIGDTIYVVSNANVRLSSSSCLSIVKVK